MTSRPHCSGARCRPWPASARWSAGKRSEAIAPGCGSRSSAATPWATAAVAAASARLDPFREERRDDPRQHVAGAGGRERRRPVRRDEHSLARRGDDRVGALQQHDRAEPRRRAPRRVEPVRVDLAGVDAQEPRELAAVRCQNRRRSARERLELPERIRVEDDRDLEPLEQDPHQLDRPVASGRGLGRSRPRPPSRPPRAPGRPTAAAGGRRRPPAAAASRPRAARSRAPAASTPGAATAT